MRAYLCALIAGLAVRACGSPETAAPAGGGYVYAPSGAGSLTRGGPLVSRQAVAGSTGPGTVLR